MVLFYVLCFFNDLCFMLMFCIYLVMVVSLCSVLMFIVQSFFFFAFFRNLSFRCMSNIFFQQLLSSILLG